MIVIKRIVLLTSIFFFVPFLINAQEINTTSAQYHFPHKTIISSLDRGCFEDPTDFLFWAGREAERTTLDIFFPIDVETEKKVGESIHESASFRYVEDERLSKLRSMLRKMRNHVERKDLRYEVYLIEDESINAFTIPGGNIYVTTGIMDFVESDDELANIIGHEIGHNENRHTTKLIQRNAPREIVGDEVGIIVDVYSKLTVAYGQPDELEADRAGFYLAEKAGYNPTAGLEFWRRLARRENPNILDKFFRSHPYSETRYKCGMQHLAEHRH